MVYIILLLYCKYNKIMIFSFYRVGTINTFYSSSTYVITLITIYYYLSKPISLPNKRDLMVTY